jgi:hypothetical protein
MQIHEDITARITKSVQYKIRFIYSNKWCVGMNLGRSGCKLFEVLALVIPSINQLWKIIKDSSRCNLSHNDGWFRLGVSKSLNSGTHLFNIYIYIYMKLFIVTQCIINCFTAQYQFEDMPKGCLVVQVAQ